MGNTKKEEETKRKGRSKRTGRKPSNYRYDKLNEVQKSSLRFLQGNVQLEKSVKKRPRQKRKLQTMRPRSKRNKKRRNS